MLMELDETQVAQAILIYGEVIQFSFSRKPVMKIGGATFDV